MVFRIQIAKFISRQCLLRANSPNLMLAKLSCYVVIIILNMYEKTIVYRRQSIAMHNLEVDTLIDKFNGSDTTFCPYGLHFMHEY